MCVQIGEARNLTYEVKVFYNDRYDKSKMVYNSKSFSSRREINSGELVLPNGKYSIIPCTQMPG